MKRRSLLAAVLSLTALLVVPGISAAAQPASWIFNPSYYSHDPITHVRIGRQFSKGPVYTRPQGEHVITGYRNLHSTIRIGGQTHDHLNLWESWIQVGEQF